MRFASHAGARRGSGVVARGQRVRPGAQDLLAQVQPRARPQGAVPRRLHQMGQAGRGAHQGRSEDRRVPQCAARQGRGHHRADAPGRQPGSEHRLRAPGQLRPADGGDERPVLRRDAGGGGQAAQGAQCGQVAGRTRSEAWAQGGVLQLGAGLSPLLHQQAGEKPDDLKGQRVRTPPAPIWQESVRALGASPVAMAFGEMYPALQQKAIDGVELVYNNIPGGRFYEVLKHVGRDAAHPADQFRGGRQQVVRHPAAASTRPP